MALAVRPGAAVERSPKPSAVPLPTLTTISAIRALSQDEGARGYPVRVRGTVTHVDEKADVTVFIHDGRLGQFVRSEERRVGKEVRFTWTEDHYSKILCVGQ